MLLSSHQLGEVEQVATHVGILHDGINRCEGPLQELRAAAKPALQLRTTADVRVAALLASMCVKLESTADGMWLLALIALGTAFLGVLCMLLVTITGIGPVHWSVAFETPFRAYLASLPTMALISWLAQRMSSFALPLILGVAGLVLGGVASNSEEYWFYVPWSWSLVASIGDDGSARATALLLGAGGGTLTLLASWLHFCRADSPA